MKNNFFKSYFKAYGLIPTVVLFAVVLVLSFFIYVRPGMLSPLLTDIVTGALLVGFGGLSVIGVSKLFTREINFLDLSRVVGLLATLALAVIALISGFHYKEATAFFVIAGINLIELVVRLIVVDDQEKYTSFKYYFAAIANKYNPLFILLLGTVLALGCYICAANNITSTISFVSLKSYKYLVVGGLVALVLLIFIPSLINDPKEKYGANLLDFGLAVGFVTTLYLFVLGMNQVSLFYAKLIILGCVICAGGLLARAVTYTKGKNYIATDHKVRTYFMQTYEKYDVSLWVLFGAVIVLIFGVSTSYVSGSKAFTEMFGTKLETFSTALNYISVAGIVALIILIFVFRDFKNENIVRVDSVLISSIFASMFVIPYLVSVLLYEGSFATLTSNISLLVLLVFEALLFVISFVVLFIRIKNYNLMALIAEEARRREEARKAEEEKLLEEENQEVEEEPEEVFSPFNLTEEDEAILAAEEAKNKVEEEPVEEVVEEVVEEEPVEEVVEDTPVEETTEEIAEDAEDSEEDLDEDDDNEEESFEEVDEGDIIEEDNSDITRGIQVQEYVAVDENGTPKKIRRKFNTKMMFASYETKLYYNEVKNYLEMYRAKGRFSSRCETFRYKGLIAKVVLGGKTLKVYLALDSTFIAENPKYHLKDCSEKKQYADVPALLRIRSQRALKYFKELVDIMMANREIKPKRKFEPTNYLPTLIPNGEAILGSLGLSQDYLQNIMNTEMIPEEMPTDLEQFLPSIQIDLDEEEVEATVYLDTLCNHFEDGEVVDIDILKSKHVVTKGNVIHIKARGTMDRKLTIYADYFDEDALQILMCLSCTVIKVTH